MNELDIDSCMHCGKAMHEERLVTNVQNEDGYAHNYYITVWYCQNKKCNYFGLLTFAIKK